MTALARSRLPLLAALSVFAVVLLRTAWVCDDAYITFRVVDNFIHGYGLRWNILDRVQTYTHPLWFFVVAAAYRLTAEPYFTSLALSFAASLGALWLFARRVAPSTRMAIVGLTLFTFSKAFVDFSTSGLENPLTTLLLVAFCAACWTRRPGPRTVLVLTGLLSLVMLNRFDLGLLVLPSLAVAVARSWSLRSVAAVAQGLLPLVAWEVFSVIYYGFPFPNTAYAKLNTGIPERELAMQGLWYLRDSIQQDPLTLATILFSLGLVLKGSARATWPMSVGIILYLVYVVSIGGDFMSGRFLVAPFVCAVLQAAHYPWLGSVRMASVFAATAAGVGLLAPAPSVLSGRSFRPSPIANFSDHGITDVRRFYYPNAGLFQSDGTFEAPNDKSYALGREIRANGTRFMIIKPAGFIGYAAGPNVHLVDVWALGDPMLARLPARPGRWSIGHFSRTMPVGFPATLEFGKNVISEEGIAAYYEKIRLITQGPIWSRERWQAIYRMNLGRYDQFIRYSSYFPH